jgi:hypothetical protein
MRPRGRGKLNAELKLRDVYKNYVKDNTIKQLTSSYAESTEIVVPYTKYKKIIDSYFKKIVHFIIEESGIYKMPYALGDLRVGKHKMNISNLVKYKKLRINFKIFNTTGQKVYHLNEHRRGYSYAIEWDKSRTGQVIYKRVYKYVPTRTMSRRLAWILQNDFSKDYFEIT